MNKEMININANLIKEPTFASFMKDDKEVQVATLALLKDMAKEKSISTVPLMAIRLRQSKNLSKMTSFTYMATSAKELKTTRLTKISL